MKRAHAVNLLRTLAAKSSDVSSGSEWYLFGSVDRNENNPSDIDLMILCLDDLQADILRRTIESVNFDLPIHLSLLTYEEELEIKAIQFQSANKIFP